MKNLRISLLLLSFLFLGVFSNSFGMREFSWDRVDSKAYNFDEIEDSKKGKEEASKKDHKKESLKKTSAITNRERKGKNFNKKGAKEKIKRKKEVKIVKYLDLLFEAVKERDFAKVKFLVVNKARINVKDRFGKTPVYYAIRNYAREKSRSKTFFIDINNSKRRFEVLDFLVQKGASLDGIDINTLCSLIHDCAYYGYLDTLKAIFKKCEEKRERFKSEQSYDDDKSFESEINLDSEIFDETFNFSTHEPKSYYEKSFSKKKYLEKKDKEGKTLIASAVEGGQLAVFEFLVSKGADLGVIDYYENNLLHLAGESLIERVCYCLCYKYAKDYEIIYSKRLDSLYEEYLKDKEKKVYGFESNFLFNVANLFSTFNSFNIYYKKVTFLFKNYDYKEFLKELKIFWLNRKMQEIKNKENDLGKTPFGNDYDEESDSGSDDEESDSEDENKKEKKPKKKV